MPLGRRNTSRTRRPNSSPKFHGLKEKGQKCLNKRHFCVLSQVQSVTRPLIYHGRPGNLKNRDAKTDRPDRTRTVNSWLRLIKEHVELVAPRVIRLSHPKRIDLFRGKNVRTCVTPFFVLEYLLLYMQEIKTVLVLTTHLRASKIRLPSQT